MCSAPSKAAVISLYKQMMKESSKSSSYIYREYALRRVRDAFRENKNVTDPNKINQLIEEARINLEIIKRQVIINDLYKEGKLVIEDQSVKNNIK